ncbi:hypothetical protein O1611_g2751 [Lasiodiplodia mahajangana]|uniref:Uncharacterized protein n=1 Tax=Lasiodiplodia mahajangana TaxID=1108764 RepID=A0ACC2JTN1_9PEZI|nr:hypothetical protein O1611_g2751 [Lasiodiplodia mahajangana]
MSANPADTGAANIADTPEGPPRVPKRGDFGIEKIGHNNRDIDRVIKAAMTPSVRDTEIYRRMLAERLEVCKSAVTEVVEVTERPKFEMPKRRKLLEVQMTMQKALDEMGMNELDGGCGIILVGLFPYIRQGGGTGGG